MKRWSPYPSPAPAEIRALRLRANLTHREAGGLIYCAERTFQDWEGGRRSMAPQLWEAFRIKAGRIRRQQFPHREPQTPEPAD